LRRLVLLALVAAILAPPAFAATRRGTRAEAIQACAREMSRRFDGASVQVEQVRRVTRRGDRLSVEARMRARRVGRDVSREVDCAVDFSGRRPRIAAFSVGRDPTTGGGWGGQSDSGDARAARICWREAQAAGYPIRSVLSVRSADRGGRLVVLRSGVNNEVQCLYRNGVRGLHYRRR